MRQEEIPVVLFICYQNRKCYWNHSNQWSNWSMRQTVEVWMSGVWLWSRSQFSICKWLTEKLKSGANLQWWNSCSFFDCMFASRSSSVSIKRKCDVIFQIIFNLIHKGQRKTPFHTAISQSIHDTCISKNLIQIFSRLGLGIVPKNINSFSIIHGAMITLITRQTRSQA